MKLLANLIIIVSLIAIGTICAAAYVGWLIDREAEFQVAEMPE